MCKLDPAGVIRWHERDKGKALAGKSKLNRLETFAVGDLENPRYKNIICSPETVKKFFTDSFIRSTPERPEEIVVPGDPTRSAYLPNYWHSAVGYLIL